MLRGIHKLEQRLRQARKSCSVHPDMALKIALPVPSHAHPSMQVTRKYYREERDVSTFNDRAMVASAADIRREEARSRAAGRAEDLAAEREELRRAAEKERRLEAAAKKRHAKRGAKQRGGGGGMGAARMFLDDGGASDDEEDRSSDEAE